MALDAVQNPDQVPPSPPAIIQSALPKSVELDQASFSVNSQELKNETLKVHGFAQSTILNRWASDAGFLIGEDPVSQNVIGFQLQKLTAFVWNNIDLSSGSVHEVDVGASYTLVNRQVGPGQLKFDIGGQAWFYPSALLSANSKFDVLATASVSWSGPITLAADYKHLFGGQTTEDPGELLVLKASREQPLYNFKDKSKLSLKVETQVPFRHDFFLKEDFGIPCVRPGVSFRWQDSAGDWAVELMGRYQIGIDGKTPSQGVFGFSINHSW